jgi:hypothetical protein
MTTEPSLARALTILVQLRLHLSDALDLHRTNLLPVDEESLAGLLADRDDLHLLALGAVEDPPLADA